MNPFGTDMDASHSEARVARYEEVPLTAIEIQALVKQLRANGVRWAKRERRSMETTG